MFKRIFDIIFSFFILLLLLPIMFFIALIIFIVDGPPVFFLQTRVGKDGKTFKIIKFRTMRPNSDKNIQITVGSNDNRITRTGRFLRKYKLDELPQFFNVLKGEMSVVGPRPEVPKYVEFYDERQKQVLSVKPGITDWASIAYIDENDMLKGVDDPESYYIQNIMPQKLELNLQYIKDSDKLKDFKILWHTFLRIIR
ncbi:MAG: glycosyl transferase [Vicingaceae bacterium]|nr:MAG: glycosyl transferase [Vicingaceae bacterium]